MFILCVATRNAAAAALSGASDGRLARDPVACDAARRVLIGKLLRWLDRLDPAKPALPEFDARRCRTSRYFSERSLTAFLKKLKHNHLAAELEAERGVRAA